MTEGPPIELIGGFETTYIPHHDRDVAETTEHDVRWRDDLALLRATGVTRLRYPVRWHRVEAEERRFDWRATDQVMEHLAADGFRPIVDLVHHTSYPRWLADGFADPRFASAYLRFAEAVATRYPWIEEYTLFNEPFATLHLCGHEAAWPPYHEGLEGFVKLVGNVLPAVARASVMYADLLPGARHVWVDACEHHTGSGRAGTDYAAMANDRRFFMLDTFLGEVDVESRFLPLALEAGAEGLMTMEPGRIDVLGLDYYAHCQWEFGETGGVVPTPSPLPLSAQILEYSSRYDVPCMLSETNIRGYAFDRASWFKYVLEQCEIARDAGVAMDGLCWFPFVDSADWDSLLYRCEASVDPVGVYWLDERLDRRASSMSQSYAMAAAGAPGGALPAYHFAEPVRTLLQGYLPHMAHWDWQPAPREDAPTGAELADDEPLEFCVESRVPPGTEDLQMELRDTGAA